MYLPAAHIVANLRANDRSGALNEILDRLVLAEAFPASTRPAIFQALEKRELITPTGLGFGLPLAFPHGIIDLSPEPVLAFARSRSGFYFGSLDGTAIRYVCLTLASSHEQHLNALETWRQIFSKLDWGALQDCSTAEEIAALLSPG